MVAAILEDQKSLRLIGKTKQVGVKGATRPKSRSVDVSGNQPVEAANRHMKMRSLVPNEGIAPLEVLAAAPTQQRRSDSGV